MPRPNISQKQAEDIPQDDFVDDDDDDDTDQPAKRSGRRKIKIEYIQDKNRRHITFSKRKAGIMKKAYELSTLTGTQVLLLVVSETGLVYTFTTVKLQPIVTKPEGKNLIQSCLNAPDPSSQDPRVSEHAQLNSDAADASSVGSQRSGNLEPPRQSPSQSSFGAQHPQQASPNAMRPRAAYPQPGYAPANESPYPQGYGLPSHHHQAGYSSPQPQAQQLQQHHPQHHPQQHYAAVPYYPHSGPGHANHPGYHGQHQQYMQNSPSENWSQGPADNKPKLDYQGYPVKKE